jgi:hypothetical protein
MGHFESVYLGGGSGVSIVGATRYHLEEYPVPARCEFLTRYISAVAQGFQESGV